MTQPTQEQREALERLQQDLSITSDSVGLFRVDCAQQLIDLARASALALAQNPADGAEAVTGEWLESVGAHPHIAPAALYHDFEDEFGETYLRLRRAGDVWVAEVWGEYTWPIDIHARDQVRHLLAAFNQGGK